MRAIVKGFVVGTLGLAVLFGSYAISLAEPKAGANNCTQGPPQHLPPGSYCPEEYGYKETSLDNPNGPGCVVLCCKGDAGGNITNCVKSSTGGVGVDHLRNRPDLPATIYQPSTTVPPSRVTPPGGILQKSP